MKIRVVIGAVALLCLLVAALIYLGINRPWWQERGELERIFSGSTIQLSSASNRGGNLFCLDSCPSLTVSLNSTPYTYGAFTASLAIALRDHGYPMKTDDLRLVNDVGQIITSPFNCIAPNKFNGSVKYWQCQFNASGDKYHLYGFFEISGDVKPQQSYRQGDLEVSGSMPPAAQLVGASLTLEKTR